MLNARRWGGTIATLIPLVLLAHTTMASAQTVSTTHTSSTASSSSSSSSNHHADVIPYLIQYPGQNQVLGVRCVQSSARFDRSTVREPSVRVLRPTSTEPVTIAVQGQCDEVWIRVQPDNELDSLVLDESFDRNFDDDFNDDWYSQQDDPDWRTREGSGWHWLLHH